MWVGREAQRRDAGETARVVSKPDFVGLWQERERSADYPDCESPDSTSFGSVSVVHGASGTKADNQTAREDRRDPGGMVVPLRSGELCAALPGTVKIDADDGGAIESKAYTGWIAGRVAKEISIGCTGEETVHRRPVIVTDDDWFAVGKVLHTLPCRVSRRIRRWAIGQRLRDCRDRKQETCGEEKLKVFHTPSS